MLHHDRRAALPPVTIRFKSAGYALLLRLTWSAIAAPSDCDSCSGKSGSSSSPLSRICQIMILMSPPCSPLCGLSALPIRDRAGALAGNTRAAAGGDDGAATLRGGTQKQMNGGKRHDSLREIASGGRSPPAAQGSNPCRSSSAIALSKRYGPSLTRLGP